MAKIRHKKKEKEKKTPYWRWCSPPLASHGFISITTFQRSWNTREEPGLGQVFEEDHLKAHEFCKRKCKCKAHIYRHEEEEEEFVCSLVIQLHLGASFRFKFLFQLSAIRSSSLALCAGMSEWVRGDEQAQDATCCEDRAYDGCFLLLLLLRLYRRRAAGELEGAGAVSISSSSSWIPRKRRFGSFPNLLGNSWSLQKESIELIGCLRKLLTDVMQQQQQLVVVITSKWTAASSQGRK